MLIRALGVTLGNGKSGWVERTLYHYGTRSNYGIGIANAILINFALWLLFLRRHCLFRVVDVLLTLTTTSPWLWLNRGWQAHLKPFF